MNTSGIFDGRGISNAANEAIREARHAELMQRIAQVRADQNSFAVSRPSGSGTRPGSETTGPIAFHGSSPEVAGSMGVRRPDLGVSFGSGEETAGTIAFHGSSPEVAGSMGMAATEADLSFRGGLGIREIKRYNANTMISDGKNNIAQGKALIAASKRPENSNCAASLRSQGQSKINEGERQVAKGKERLRKI